MQRHLVRLICKMSLCLKTRKQWKFPLLELHGCYLNLNSSALIAFFPPHLPLRFTFFFFKISALYDKCIFKFDHYCAWTNNCVGGLNHRYFTGYLVTICAMCANGVVMATRALVVITMRYQLLALRYVDDSGQAHPMTFRVLIQVM